MLLLLESFENAPVVPHSDITAIRLTSPRPNISIKLCRLSPFLFSWKQLHQDSRAQMGGLMHSLIKKKKKEVLQRPLRLRDNGGTSRSSGGGRWKEESEDDKSCGWCATWWGFITVDRDMLSEKGWICMQCFDLYQIFDMKVKKKRRASSFTLCLGSWGAEWRLTCCETYSDTSS